MQNICKALSAFYGNHSNASVLTYNLGLDVDKECTKNLYVYL